MAWEQQSPINLKASFRAKAPRNYLSLNWATAEDGFFQQDDHGLKAVFPFQNDDYLTLEGKQFHLKEFHFHHPAEHLLEGETRLAELHIVHQNRDDATCAVIGVFLAIGDDAAGKSEKGLAAGVRNAKESGAAIPLKLDEWLPEDRDRVFRYEGSLTTPPYAEIVSWVVFRAEKKISRELFTAIFGEHPQGARGVQARSRRYVIDLDVKIKIDRGEPGDGE